MLKTLQEFDIYLESAPLEEIITYLIQLNDKYRHIDQTDGYYTIRREDFFITPSDRFNNLALKIEHVNNSPISAPTLENLERISQYYPHSENLVLAGGSIIGALRNTQNIPERIVDYDYFFLNLPEFDNIYQIINENTVDPYLNNHEQQQVDYIKYKINYNTITVRKRQYILRNYENINQILYGFDLSASQIALDQEHIYISPACYFNLKYNLLFLNLSVSSPSYLPRIVKYVQEKHFNLYLANKYLLRYSRVSDSTEINIENSNIDSVSTDYGFLKVTFNQDLYITGLKLIWHKKKQIASEYEQLNQKISNLLIMLRNGGYINTDHYEIKDNKVITFKDEYINIPPNKNYFHKDLLADFSMAFSRERFRTRFITRQMTYNKMAILDELLGRPLFIRVMLENMQNYKNHGRRKIIKLLMKYFDIIYENYLEECRKYEIKLKFRGLTSGTHLLE